MVLELIWRPDDMCRSVANDSVESWRPLCTLASADPTHVIMYMWPSVGLHAQVVDIIHLGYGRDWIWFNLLRWVNMSERVWRIYVPKHVIYIVYMLMLLVAEPWSWIISYYSFHIDAWILLSGFISKSFSLPYQHQWIMVLWIWSSNCIAVIFKGHTFI